MIAIIDSSPLISLAVIKQLELLDRLFSDIVVPQAVYEEIIQKKYKEEALVIHRFIKNRVCRSQIRKRFRDNLGKGETEAIQLCLELQVDLLIIDDKKARNTAEVFDIKCVGTLGILTLAKKKGLIKELRPYFDQFIHSGRYYSFELMNQILRLNQEDPF